MTVYYNEIDPDCAQWLRNLIAALRAAPTPPHGVAPLCQPTQHWAVAVERNGETVLNIASNFLSGRDLGPEDKATIRTAAEHLLAFIGYEAPLPSQDRVRLADRGLKFAEHVRGGGSFNSRDAADLIRDLAIAALPASPAAPADVVEALRNVHKIICEAAMTGFNCHDGDWAERLFASQQKTHGALSRLQSTDKGEEG